MENPSAMQPETVPPLHTHKLRIYRNGERWMVSKPTGRTDRRNSTIEWTFDPSVKEGVRAHFQFTSSDLFVRPSFGLSRDLTATLEPGKTLKLHLDIEACRRKNPRYYAVWIEEGGTGQFAVGEDGNPPPEINVGP